MDIYLPKNRSLPFHEVPPQFPGDLTTIIIDGGTCDKTQLEDLTAKVKEDAAERLKKQGGRIRQPLLVSITRFISKNTHKITKYVVEVKGREKPTPKFY